MVWINRRTITNQWCIYTLQNKAGVLVFIWAAKLANAMSARDAMSNPALKDDEDYYFQIAGVYPDQRHAQAALGEYLRKNPWPEFNKTVRWNRRTRVKCNETGQTWRNGAECASQLGINRAQLSQHLRRNPGYKTIRGLTFSNIPDEQAIQPVQYPIP